MTDTPPAAKVSFAFGIPLAAAGSIPGPSTIAELEQDLNNDMRQGIVFRTPGVG